VVLHLACRRTAAALEELKVAPGLTQQPYVEALSCSCFSWCPTLTLRLSPLLQEKGLEWESFFEKVRHLNTTAPLCIHVPGKVALLLLFATMCYVCPRLVGHSLVQPWLTCVVSPFRLQLKKNGQWHVEVY